MFTTKTFSVQSCLFYGGVNNNTSHDLFLFLYKLSYFMFREAAMARNSLDTSEKAGLEEGSDDQHLSINDLQTGSHQLGISGRRSPLIMPAERIHRSRTSKWVMHKLCKDFLAHIFKKLKELLEEKKNL